MKICFRLPIDQENALNQFFWAEFERHNAEIAAFHVDRSDLSFIFQFVANNKFFFD